MKDSKMLFGRLDITIVIEIYTRIQQQLDCQGKPFYLTKLSIKTKNKNFRHQKKLKEYITTKTALWRTLDGITILNRRRSIHRRSQRTTKHCQDRKPKIAKKTPQNEENDIGFQRRHMNNIQRERNYF